MWLTVLWFRMDCCEFTFLAESEFPLLHTLLQALCRHDPEFFLAARVNEQSHAGYLLSTDYAIRFLSPCVHLGVFVLVCTCVDYPQRTY